MGGVQAGLALLGRFFRGNSVDFTQILFRFSEVWGTMLRSPS